MSSSLKQEALGARKGKFKQITIKCICKRRDPDNPRLYSQSGQSQG